MYTHISLLTHGLYLHVYPHISTDTWLTYMYTHISLLTHGLYLHVYPHISTDIWLIPTCIPTYLY